MILIQSLALDRSTNDVVRWLCKYKADFQRLNDITEIKSLNCSNDEYVLE